MIPSTIIKISKENLCIGNMRFDRNAIEAIMFKEHARVETRRCATIHDFKEEYRYWKAWSIESVKDLFAKRGIKIKSIRVK